MNLKALLLVKFISISTCLVFYIIFRFLAQLNLQEFHLNDLEIEYDPPSYVAVGLADASESVPTEFHPFPEELVTDAVFNQIHEEDELSNEEELQVFSTVQSLKKG
jgi:hypothetical protein